MSAGFVKGNFKNPVNLLDLPLHILISLFRSTISPFSYYYCLFLFHVLIKSALMISLLTVRCYSGVIRCCYCLLLLMIVLVVMFIV